MSKIEKIGPGQRFVAGLYVGDQLVEIIDYEVTAVELEELQKGQNRRVARLRELSDPKKLLSIPLKALRRGRSGLLVFEPAANFKKSGVLA